MVNPRKLNDVVVETINARIGDEYTAHYFYTAAHNWCVDANYENAAAFFKHEMEDELNHSHQLQKWLVDWNCLPTIPEFKTAFTFTSLPDIIEQAYRLELDLLDKYLEDSRSIFSVDLATFDFLRELREGQAGSVIEYADKLAALELIDVNVKLDVLHFEEMYFKM